MAASADNDGQLSDPPPANLRVSISRIVARLTPRQARALSVGSVGLVHVILLFALIWGIALPQTAPKEVSLVLVGGPPGALHEVQTLPDLARPEQQDIAPPALEIQPSTAIATEKAIAPGSANVTRPAMAIASVHDFPPLPAEYANLRSATVRLVLSIETDGSISTAQIRQSSGVASLDRIALDWVEKHWRYLPALQNGYAVATTDTAIIAFVKQS